MGNRIQSIAGTIFALAFIAVMAMIQMNVLGIGNNINDQLARTNIATEMHELAAFDDTTVTGATVISAIKNYDTLYDYDMTITVKTGSVERSYGASGNTYNITNASDSAYINPTKTFAATLRENTNGMVTTIYFEQKN